MFIWFYNHHERVFLTLFFCWLFYVSWNIFSFYPQKIRMILMAEKKLVWAAVDTFFHLRYNEVRALADCLAAVESSKGELARARDFFKDCSICFTEFGRTQVTTSIYLHFFLVKTNWGNICGNSGLNWKGSLWGCTGSSMYKVCVGIPAPSVISKPSVCILDVKDLQE